MENYHFSDNSNVYKAEIEKAIRLLEEKEPGLICYVSEIYILQGALVITHENSKCLLVSWTERAARELLRHLPAHRQFLCYFDEIYRGVINEYLHGTSDEIQMYQTTGMRIGDIQKRGLQTGSSKEKIIYSKKDETAAEFRQYNTLKERINSGTYIIEGMLLVERALKDGLPVEKVVYSDSMDEGSRNHIAQLCQKNECAYYRASSGLMAAMTAAHPTPEIICSVRIKVLNQKDLIITGGRNFFLVLDGISNPDNLGMVLRTADAAGVHAVILLSNSTHFLNKNAIRGARGAVGRIPIYFSSDDDELMAKLKRKEFKIFGTSAKFNSNSFYHLDYDNHNNAIVIGNESIGVRSEILEQCTDYVKIPMAEGQSSLNIAVASALMMYEYVRMFY